MCAEGGEGPAAKLEAFRTRVSRRRGRSSWAEDRQPRFERLVRFVALGHGPDGTESTAAIGACWVDVVNLGEELRPCDSVTVARVQGLCRVVDDLKLFSGGIDLIH